MLHVFFKLPHYVYVKNLKGYKYILSISNIWLKSIADFMPKDKWGETIVTSYDNFMFRFGLMFKYKREDIVKEYLELIKAGKLQELLRDRINTMG